MDASALETTIRRRDARRFCELILPGVSRTFALGIRVLPGELGRSVLVAYLLCRIADSIEDEPAISPDEKAALLDRFRECLSSSDAGNEFATRVKHLTGEPAHVTLLHNADLVFQQFFALTTGTQRIVREWVSEMANGMKKFVILYPRGIRIQTVEEYREYCYYVAGTVGYMLTDLWYEHSRVIGRAHYERLRELCRAFGEALQTVNILKDIAKDIAYENSIYVPEQLLREHGSSHAALVSPELAPNAGAGNRTVMENMMQLAWRGLDDARAYVTLIPRRAVAIRVFCALPMLLAYATLRELAAHERAARPARGAGDAPIKISRAEVKTLLVTGSLLIFSNRGVRWLVERVRARPFVIA